MGFSQNTLRSDYQSNNSNFLNVLNKRKCYILEQISVSTKIYKKKRVNRSVGGEVVVVDKFTPVAQKIVRSSSARVRCFGRHICRCGCFGLRFSCCSGRGRVGGGGVGTRFR